MKNSGFTLIEFLLYLGLIGLVATSFVSFAITVGGNVGRLKSSTILADNLTFSLATITGAVKNAENIITPVAGSSGNTLVLDRPSPLPDLSFLVVGNRLVRRSSGSPDEVLTDVAVRVSVLTFTQLPTTSGRGNALIRLTLAPLAVTGGPGPVSGQTAVSVRQ